MVFWFVIKLFTVGINTFFILGIWLLCYSLPMTSKMLMVRNAYDIDIFKALIGVANLVAEKYIPTLKNSWYAIDKHRALC